MKKILSLILVATLAPFALSGCGGSKNTTTLTPNSPATSQPNSPSETDSLTQSWYSYTDSTGGYSVKFPQKPEEQNQPLDSQLGKLNLLLVFYNDTPNRRVYLTGNVKYPVDPAQYNVEKGLDGARDGAAQNTSSTILDEKKINLNGYPGREIVMKNPQGIVQKIRFYIDPKGPTLYQAIVGSEDGNINFPEADAFLNSLTFK